MGSESGWRSSGALRLVPRDDDGVTPEPARRKLDDDSLLAAIRAGEPTVAAILCDRLWPQVDRTIRRLLGRLDSDREDLGQIALIEIVNTIGRYRGECSLERWAQTVTAHVVFNHLRRRKIERRLFSDLLADDLYSSNTHVENASLARQLLGRVAGHLDRMSAPRVWAFLLHDVLGYDLDEISAMTKVSVAAAQSRLSRGRRELHELIALDPELIGLIQNDELGT